MHKDCHYYPREETEPVLDTEARYDVRLRAAKRSGGGHAESRHSYDGGGGGEQGAGRKLFNCSRLYLLNCLQSVLVDGNGKQWQAIHTYVYLSYGQTNECRISPVPVFQEWRGIRSRRRSLRSTTPHAALSAD